MECLLVTGFDAFGGLAQNVSERVVHALPGVWRGSCRLHAVVLPTIYDGAGARIRQLITVYEPAAIVLLGVARTRSTIELERVALNLDDSETADNEHHRREGVPIEASGPVGYWSTLPLQAMRTRLQALQIPVVISNHAGTFLCNHVFYAARAELERRRLRTPCGFVHLPDIGDNDDAGFQQAMDAVVACLEVVAETVSSIR